MNIEQYLKNPQIWEYKVIKSAEIPFSEDVVNMCKSNQCGKYGTCWTCPPGVGELDVLESKIKSYENAAVFTYKQELEDCFDFEGMTEGQQKARAVLDEIISKLVSDEVQFMALGCEGCHICEKCTYPDAPCRFPERAVPSVEACGINVVELSRKAGIKYNNGAETVTYFCVILF